MSAALGAAAREVGTVAGYFAAVGREIAEISFTGPRALLCTRTALSVVLAVTLAQWASLGDVWWAGISGLMASQATGPASIQRAVLRVVATAMGAGAGVIGLALFAYDQAGLTLFLFIAAFAGVLGTSVSPHGYGWMFGGLTASMVVLMSLTDPGSGALVAITRVIEVTVGCSAAVVMALLLAPDQPEAAVTAPGWGDLVGQQWPAVQHAVRSGLAAASMPFIWSVFNLPGLSQMAITVVAVTGVPVLAADPRSLSIAVFTRAKLRIVGCLCGGTLGLLCLAIPLTLYPVWLAALFAGVWLCAHVQASQRGVSYAGVQGAVVYIMTLVQGPGPPSSILPGIDRFGGILGGLTVLTLLSLLLWPSPPQGDEATPPSPSMRERGLQR